MAFDCLYLDFGNPESEQNFKHVQQHFPYVRKQRFFGDFKGTLDRIINKSKTEWCWITSSISDYNSFDFDFELNYHQRNQMHVFGVNRYEEGDTFLINVNEYTKQKDSIEWLRDYKHINYHTSQDTKRIEYEKFYFDLNDGIEQIKEACTKSTQQYFWYINKDATIDPTFDFTWCPSYWEPNKIFVFDDHGDVMMVPKSIMMKVSEQMYDFDLLRFTKVRASRPRSQDVIFISNGESNAEENWSKLIAVCPRAKRSDGVKGRTQAYQAAARMSDTPYFFAVFGKINVVDTFKFDYQPDRLRDPRHYIFHSQNPVNGLEYGHMGVILYHKKTVLETKEMPGLDFTLASKHEVVPQLSAVANYNTDPYSTWRTAFRESLKLKVDCETKPTVESKYRLNKWCTVSQGNNGEWSVRGACDAIEYYNSVQGNPTELLKSYEWDWLKNYFDTLSY